MTLIPMPPEMVKTRGPVKHSPMEKRAKKSLVSFAC
jgi:hypothetical protein